jgi:hypothetical protein
MTDTPLPNRDVFRMNPNGVAVLTTLDFRSLARNEAAASDARTTPEAMRWDDFRLIFLLFIVPLLLYLVGEEGDRVLMAITFC